MTDLLNRLVLAVEAYTKSPDSATTKELFLARQKVDEAMLDIFYPGTSGI